MEKLLTIKTVADILSVAKGTVYKLIRNGELQAVKVSNRTRVRTSELERYFKQLDEPVMEEQTFPSDDVDKAIEELQSRL